jgi:hypothetical protein
MYARRVIDIAQLGNPQGKALGKGSFAYFSLKKSKALSSEKQS